MRELSDGHPAAVVPNNQWTETGLTRKNKPASGESLARWTARRGVPVEFDVTALLNQPLVRDKKLSLHIPMRVSFRPRCEAFEDRTLPSLSSSHYAPAVWRQGLMNASPIPRMTLVQGVIPGLPGRRSPWLVPFEPPVRRPQRGDEP
jgi:hypothetical protein